MGAVLAAAGDAWPVVAVTTQWSWTISQVPLVGNQYPVDDLGPGRAHPTFGVPRFPPRPGPRYVGFAAYLLQHVTQPQILGRVDRFLQPNERARTLAVMAGAPVSSVTVDSNEVSQWFGEYADAFVACGRGESGPSSLLAYYGVPLLLTTDDGFPR